MRTLKTPSKVKVSKIKKFFEDKVKGKTPRKDTVRDVRRRRVKTLIQELSSSDDDMSSDTAKDQRTPGTGPYTEDMETTDSSRKRGREDTGIQGNPEKQARDTRDTDERRTDDKGDKADQVVDLSEIQQIMEAGGAGHLFGAIKDKIMELMQKLLDKQARVFKQIMVDTRRRDKELDRCSRSVLIHNAHKLIAGDDDDDEVATYTLAEKVTEAVTTLCRGMVTVTEAFPMGRTVEGKQVTSICVVLGSNRQKGVIYKTVAGHMRHKTSIGKALQDISLRDVFPKDLIPEAQRLVQRGMALKKNQQIASFKVCAQGAGVIPVLFVRDRDSSGRLGPWRVFQSQMRAIDRDAEDGTRARNDSGEWQEVSSRGRKRNSKDGSVTDGATGGRDKDDSQGRGTTPGSNRLWTDPYLAGIDPDLQDDFIRRAQQRIQQHQQKK